MKYKHPMPLFVNAFNHPIEGDFSDLVGVKLDEALALKILATHKVNCKCSFCEVATERLIKKQD